MLSSKEDKTTEEGKNPTRVTNVETLRPDGSREIHSSKEEIEDIYMEENKRKFFTDK